MSQMDSLTVAVTGGFKTNPLGTLSQNSYFYNILNGVWTDGPLLKEMRAQHGCSLISGKDGKPTTIIAGGSDGKKKFKSVEIYNRNLNIWEKVQDLPTDMASMQVKYMNF